MKRKVVAMVFASLIVSLLVVSCSPYGRHDRYGGGRSGSGEAQRAYQIGYERGYDHGIEDRRRGENFDFEHDDAFRRGISSNPYINDQFRSGYARGYQEAYYGGRRY